MKSLFLYLHTHWDREWYLPYETFRVHLTKVVGAVLDGLESGQLPSFYLDGQSVALEDATAICPDLTGRLRDLMKTGRLAAGPWYVLADQMLVGGESLVRNLKLGIESTSRFGSPAMIGYCPDTFGHSGDLPRILSGFGIKTAVVWRGVPELPADPVFAWESPDGSRVTTFHLSRGYYQSSFHENIPAGELAERLLGWLKPAERSNGLANSYCRLVGGALHPVGCDHLGPPVLIEQKIQDARNLLSQKLGEDLEIVVLPLPEFLSRLEQAFNENAADNLVIDHELRSNSAAKAYGSGYLLPGVLSTRLYLKRENRLAEHRLIALSEPLLTLLSIAGMMKYPEPEFKHIWRLLLLNHPHDSICGCSVDAVHEEMQTRTKRFNQVLDALDSQAKQALAGAGQSIDPRDPDFGADCLVVYNLSGQSVSGPVLVEWAERMETPQPKNNLDIQMISSLDRDELFGGRELVPYYKDVSLRKAWVWCDSVDSLGFREVRWNGGREDSARTQSRKATPASASARLQAPVRLLSNGLLKVAVDREGTLVVEVTEEGRPVVAYKLGHKLRDVGDGGDTYNFDPLVGDIPLYAELKSVKAGQKGPLVASLKLEYEIEIPEALAKGESAGAPPAVRARKRLRHIVTTEVSLRRGSPIVFFETAWDNRSGDHRLEVVFDTGAAIAKSYSENHFSLTEREHSSLPQDLPVEPGCEAAPDRFPCQRFFIANRQLFLNVGLPEYAIDGNEASITLLRAVSILSRGALRTRGGGAGPHLPTPGANCLGVNRATYGWAPLTAQAAGSGKGADQMLSDRAKIESYRLAEQFEGTLWATTARRGASLSSHSFVRVSNQAVRLSALYADKDGQAIILRLLNVTGVSQSVELGIGFAYSSVGRCGLDGRQRLESLAFENRPAGEPSGFSLLKVNFGKNELVTLRFDT